MAESHEPASFYVSARNPLTPDQVSTYALVAEPTPTVLDRAAAFRAPPAQVVPAARCPTWRSGRGSVALASVLRVASPGNSERRTRRCRRPHSTSPLGRRTRAGAVRVGRSGRPPLPPPRAPSAALWNLIEPAYLVTMPDVPLLAFLEGMLGEMVPLPTPARDAPDSAAGVGAMWPVPPDGTPREAEMRNAVEVLLEQAGGDAKDVIVWEVLKVAMGSNPARVAAMARANASSPRTLCGAAGHIVSGITAEEKDRLVKLGAKLESKQRPGTFPDMWPD
jgi:hypothetical protein